MSKTVLKAVPHRLGAHRRFFLDASFRFRALTLGNTLNVLVSGLAWAMSTMAGTTGVWPWLLVLFPVVWVAIGAPLVCIGITAFAALMSLLSLLSEAPGHRARAWLRAFTVWGAGILSLSFTLGGVLLLSRALGF